MLDPNPHRRVQTIDRPLRRTQGSAWARLEGQIGLSLLVLDTLVAFVEPVRQAHRDLPRMPLKDLQIVDATGGEGRGQYLLGLQVNAQLRLERVVLFLATVVMALFFLGRSIGVSVASTATAGLWARRRCTRSRRLGR